MMQDASNQDLLVILEEEYGYRHWFWYPGMNDSELIKWWESLETVDPYFMTPEPLPGKLMEVDDLDEWTKKDKSKKYFYAHTHCDDDSILISPNGTKYYHKGYEGKN